MSAIGMPASRGKGFVMSAYADYRHDHLVFQRMQSHTLREMEWEGRLKPICPWSAILMRGLGVAGLATALLFVVT